MQAQLQDAGVSKPGHMKRIQYYLKKRLAANNALPPVFVPAPDGGGLAESEELDQGTKRKADEAVLEDDTTGKEDDDGATEDEDKTESDEE